jgi:hypothetical protein
LNPHEGLPRRILNPLRLPFRHFGRFVLTDAASSTEMTLTRRALPSTRASMSLQKAIEALSREFVAGVLAAVRRASLEDIADVTGQARARAVARVSPRKSPGKSKAGRLPRRSAADLEKATEDIVALLGRHPKGLRAEEIRKELELDPRELPRPIQEGLDSKRIGKRGQKRATTYFVRKA